MSSNFSFAFVCPVSKVIHTKYSINNSGTIWGNFPLGICAFVFIGGARDYKRRLRPFIQHIPNVVAYFRYIGRKKCGIFGVFWVAILGHIFSMVLDFASINKKLSFSDILGEYIFGVGLAVNNLEFSLLLRG